MYIYRMREIFERLNFQKFLVNMIWKKYFQNFMKHETAHDHKR